MRLVGFGLAFLCVGCRDPQGSATVPSSGPPPARGVESLAETKASAAKKAERSPPPEASTGEGILLVLNKSEASLSLIDPAAGTTVQRIAVGDGPHEVAVSADGRLAVVANYGASTAGSTLTIVDLHQRKAVDTVDLSPHRRPHGIQWHPDGTHVIVTTEASQSVLCVDIPARKVDCVIETGKDGSHMVALAPDGTRAYVASIGSGTMSALDLDAKSVIGHVETGRGAEGIAVTRDGREVWITNRSADTVSVVDTQRLAVTHTLPSASFPIRAEVTHDGRHVLVSNAESGSLSVFDAQKHERVRTLDFADLVADLKLPADGPAPIGIEIDPRGGWAYVALAQADMIAVVDLDNWTVTRRFPAAGHPDGMGFARVEPSGP